MTDLDKLSNQELLDMMIKKGETKPGPNLDETQIVNLVIQCSKQMGLDLNQEQLYFIMNDSRVLMNEACPGAGKTTITVLKLIREVMFKGMDPSRVCFISYTRGSVADVKHKYNDLLYKANMTTRRFGITSDKVPNIRSLNSLAYNIVDQYKLDFGLSSIDIITGHDSRKVMRGVLNNYVEDGKIKKYYAADVSDLVSLYDYVNETLAMPSSLTHLEKVNKLSIPAEILDQVIYSYRTIVQLKGKIHHSDTTRMVIEKARIDENFKKIVSSIYDYIIVDEFQDVSEAMYQLVTLLVGDSNRMVAIGDGDQAIYGFRGARANNCQRFIDEVEDAQMCYMTYNRRSKREIIEYAKDVMTAVKDRTPKPLHHIHEGGVVNITEYNDKVQVIKELIVRLKKVENKDLGEICVGYRKNFSCYYLTLLFTEAGVPFRIRDDFMPGTDPLSLAIDGALSLLRSPGNLTAIENNLYRLCGISRQDNAIEDLMDEHDVDYFYEIPIDALNVRTNSNKVREEMERLKDLSDRLRSRKTLDEIIPEMMVLLTDNYWGYTAMVTDFPKDLESLIVEDFTRPLTYIGFKEHKMKLEEEVRRSSKMGYGVQLSTFHSLKGLEFDEVHLIELAEDTFPSLSLSEDTTEEEILQILSEELRLFYVACTRARNELNLYWDLDFPSMFKEINTVYLNRKKDRVIEIEEDSFKEALSAKVGNIDIGKSLKPIELLEDEIEINLDGIDLDVGIDLDDVINSTEDIDLVNDIDLTTVPIEDMEDAQLEDVDLNDIDLESILITDITDMELSQTEDEDSVTPTATLINSIDHIDMDGILNKIKIKSNKTDMEDIPEYIIEETEEDLLHPAEDFEDVEDGDKLRNILNLICREIEV